MNSLDLYRAINEIDIKLVNEANNVDKNKILPYKKIVKIGVSAAAAVAVVIGGSLYGHKNSQDALTDSTEKNQTLGTVAKENKSNITTSADNNDVTTHFNLPSTDYTQRDYSSYTFLMWISDPNVVWKTDGHKGDQIIEQKAPLGTIRIEDSLKKIMRNRDDSTVYAVFVDYSSCIDERDFWNWNYKGTTAAKLLNKLRTVKEDDPEFEKAWIDYNNRFMEIQSAYCKMKTDEFRDTFKKVGLDIYYFNKEGVNTGAYYFYTFATKAQIDALNCKDTEAFVLTLADQLK